VQSHTFSALLKVWKQHFNLKMAEVRLQTPKNQGSQYNLYLGAPTLKFSLISFASPVVQTKLAEIRIVAYASLHSIKKTCRQKKTFSHPEKEKKMAGQGNYIMVSTKHKRLCSHSEELANILINCFPACRCLSIRSSIAAVACM
jgi:hypothetical protein